MASERLRRIAELQENIEVLQDELQALEVEEARAECSVKEGDIIEINHGNKQSPRIRRWRVTRIGARFGTTPDVWAKGIRKDGTLGEQKRIWQRFEKVNAPERDTETGETG